MRKKRILIILTLFVLLLCSGIFVIQSANNRSIKVTKKAVMSIYDQHRVPDFALTKEIFDRCWIQSGFDKNSCFENEINSIKNSLENENDPQTRLKLMEQLACLYIILPNYSPEALNAYKKVYEYSKEHGDLNYQHDLLSKLAIVKLKLLSIDECEFFPVVSPCPVIHENAKEYGIDLHGALKDLESALSYDPEDMHLRWLYTILSTQFNNKINIVSELLIDFNIVFSNTEFPLFKNVTHDFGLGTRKVNVSGVILDDFNGDGYLDAIISSSDGGTTYYINNHGKNYSFVKNSGLDAHGYATNVSQVDFDNDGLLDIYLHRGGWRSKNENVHNILLKNIDGKKFEDVTDSSGLGREWNSNVASIWGDINNDGWMDLFVCSEVRHFDLFINRKGKFTSAIEGSGISKVEEGKCKGAAWGDYNNDGFIDLFISVWEGPNILYENKGDGTFQRVSMPSIEEKPYRAFSVWFFDYNNDGWLDLFISTLSSNPSDWLLYEYGQENNGAPVKLYKNLGGKQFVDVTNEIGIEHIGMVMGSNYADLNNDGHHDIVFGTGTGSMGAILPNRIFANISGNGFREVTKNSGLASMLKGHGVSMGDVNNDGQVDILMNLGGMYNSDGAYPGLYLNPGSANEWITIRLEGTKSNRFGVGSRVRINIIDSQDEIKTFHHLIGSGSSYGANSLQLEAGLGNAKKIQSIEIDWGGSATSQRINSPPMKKIIKITEGVAGYKIEK
jgi:hypothetical protein